MPAESVAKRELRDIRDTQKPGAREKIKEKYRRDGRFIIHVFGGGQRQKGWIDI